QMTASSSKSLTQTGDLAGLAEPVGSRTRTGERAQVRGKPVDLAGSGALQLQGDAVVRIGFHHGAEELLLARSGRVFVGDADEHRRAVEALGEGLVPFGAVVVAVHQWNSATNSIGPRIAWLKASRSSAGIQYSRCSRPPACSIP